MPKHATPAVKKKQQTDSKKTKRKEEKKEEIFPFSFHLNSPMINTVFYDAKLLSLENHVDKFLSFSF